jgi:hypothetical protein
MAKPAAIEGSGTLGVAGADAVCKVGLSVVWALAPHGAKDRHCRRRRRGTPKACNNILTMRPNPLLITTAKTVLGLLVMAAGAISAASTPPPEPKPKPAPMPPRPFRIINSVCDLSENEISPGGQFVCRYVCRDRDKTKASVVYSTSGTGQCRTPVNLNIKQYIDKDKP